MGHTSLHHSGSVDDLETFLQLLVLLLLARAFGAGAERLGQSSSAGELIAGVALAAGLALFGGALPFLGDMTDSDVLGAVA